MSPKSLVPLLSPLLLLCVLLPVLDDVRRSSTPRPPVLIIGAGLSGARVALELSKMGIPFLIFESENVVGGRMRNVFLGEKENRVKIEEGANWIQGYREGDSFSDFIRKYVNLSGVLFDYEDKVYVENGIHVGKDLSKSTEKKFDDALDEVYQLKRTIVPYTELDLSVESALLLRGWEASSSLEKSIEQFHIDFEYAVPSSKVSVHDLSRIYDNEGPSSTDFFVTDPRGYNEVVREVLRQSGIPDTERSGEILKLNSTVSKILYEKKKAAIELESGESFTGSAVVFTASIGVLRSSLVDKSVRKRSLSFEPKLPIQKRIAISKIFMGDYRKLNIKFKRPILSNSDPLLVLPVQCDEHGIILLHNFNKEGYFPGSNIITITAIDNRGRELLCMDDSISLSVVLKYISGALSINIDTHDVEDYFFSTFKEKASFVGSFSIRPPGVTQHDIYQLSKNEDSLFFAGEAHSKSFRGYTQGAWESAQDCSKKIIEYLN